MGDSSRFGGFSLPTFGSKTGRRKKAGLARASIGRAAAGAIERLESRVLMSVDVLTGHYNNSRTGANTSETALTLSNVNSTTFGKLFSMPIDGYAYAQPLLKTGLAIPGQGTHDVLFVATEHDSVYAFDAHGNNPTQGYLWKDSFINPAAGVTTVPQGDVGTTDIVPEIGITSTPVIDPSTNTMYVLAKTKEVTGGVTTYVQRLHALDITTGAEKFGGPTVIKATLPGTGEGGTTISFNGLKENQRSALTLVNGVVYIAWASHGDNTPYHGWVIGYQASNIANQVAAFVDTPNGTAGGYWMAGGGIAADSSNNLYLASGNGTFDANTGGKDYADSAVKLSTASGLSLTDYFTPDNQSFLNGSDEDFGVGGSLLLPDQSGTTHVHEMITADKTGQLYLLDRDNMGKFNSNSNADLGEAAIGGQLHNVAAYFNGQIYIGGDDIPLKAYAVGNGTLGTSPASQTQNQFGTAGGDGQGTAPSISANGTFNGIVWALDNSPYSSTSPAILHAYDAGNLADELYNSTQAAGGRDTAGGAVKFTIPVVANGQVYVGGESSVTVYGLLNPNNTVPDAPPKLTAAAGPHAVALTWGASDNATTSYNVYRSTTPGGEGTASLATGITGTTYTDNSAANGTTYYYTVAGVNSIGAGIQSAEASATPQNVAPTAPTNVTAENAGLGVQISFTGEAFATYNIKRADSAGGPFTTIATGVANPSYTDNTVVNGQTYYYVVSAVNNAGESPDSTPPVSITAVVAMDVGTFSQNMKSPNIDTTGDLLLGLQPVDTDYSPTFEGGPISNLTNGTTQNIVNGVPDGNTNDGSAPTNAVFDRDPIWHATYQLDTTSNPQGYNITEIDSITGHQDYRTNQTIDIQVLPVGADPSTGWVDLATTQEDTGVTGRGVNNFSYRPNLGNGSGYLAISANGGLANHIQAVQFIALDPGAVFRELIVRGAPAPTTASLLSTGLGNGTTLSGTQRSEVRDISFKFNHAVTLSAGALTLISYGDSILTGLVINATPALGTPTTADGGLTWVVPILANTPFSDSTGSLQDAIYRVTIDPTKVTGATLTGSNLSTTFHRLYGDIDGNGTVNSADYFKFKAAFGSSTGQANFNADFDFDGNGKINSSDYFKFKANFGRKFTY
jgi:hypothetical protein